MIRPRKQLPVAALAAILAACADSATQPPPPPVVEAAAEPQSAPPEAASEPSAETSPGTAEIKKVGRNRHGDVSSISLEDFFILHQSGQALVFDARPGFFYHAGHIPGAINMPKKGCDERIRKLDTTIRDATASGKTIIVYCSSMTCPDARTVAIHLSHFGHDAKIFHGGWRAWNDADMPTQ